MDTHARSISVIVAGTRARALRPAFVPRDPARSRHPHRRRRRTPRRAFGKSARLVVTSLTPGPPPSPLPHTHRLGAGRCARGRRAGRAVPPLGRGGRAVALRSSDRRRGEPFFSRDDSSKAHRQQTQQTRAPSPRRLLRAGHHRQHADDPRRVAQRRDRVRRAHQVRVRQPRGLGQGPRRAEDCERRDGKRDAATRRRRHRGHRRLHGRFRGDGRERARLRGVSVPPR